MTDRSLSPEPYPHSLLYDLLARVNTGQASISSRPPTSASKTECPYFSQTRQVVTRHVSERKSRIRATSLPYLRTIPTHTCPSPIFTTALHVKHLPYLSRLTLCIPAVAVQQSQQPSTKKKEGLGATDGNRRISSSPRRSRAERSSSFQKDTR